MFDAQYLHAAALGSESVFGPLMSRGGDNIIATLDVIAVTGTGSFSIDLYHKAHEDAGDGSALSGSLTTMGDGRTTKGWSGLKDLVRYKITFSGGIEFAGLGLFRMLPPIWFDSVAT